MDLADYRVPTVGMEPTVDGAWDQLFLKSIVENIPHMVFVKDAEELRFVLFNKAGEELLGIPASDLIGKNDFDFFPESEAEFFVQKDREVLENRTLLDIPTEPIQTANGQRILHTKKIPLFDAGGKPIFLLGISEDITDRVAAEDELRRAYAEAESANQAKSDFMSRVSHELRTPLNAILGFSQLIQLNAGPAEREHVKHVLDAGHHLLGLVNDILDIARGETGRLSVSLEPVDVVPVINEALHMVRPMANELGVEMIPPLGEEQSFTARADSSRLRQILVNLLTNAVRFNRRGGQVGIECEVLDELRAVIKVTDTGIGMDVDSIPRIFHPFERLHAERLGIEGAGLGLAVSKNLADAMDASISVTSEPGHGSCFTVELKPAKENTSHVVELPEPRTSSAAPTSTATTTVLYVEDNPSNVKLMRVLLDPRPNVTLIVAENGESGLELAGNLRPNLILLDLNLPGISGDEVLARIKSDPLLQNIPVVIVSADATPTRIEQLRRNGASDYLTKPFEIDEILLLVARYAP